MKVSQHYLPFLPSSNGEARLSRPSVKVNNVTTRPLRFIDLESRGAKVETKVLQNQTSGMKQDDADNQQHQRQIPVVQYTKLPKDPSLQQNSTTRNGDVVNPPDLSKETVKILHVSTQSVASVTTKPSKHQIPAHSPASRRTIPQSWSTNTTKALPPSIGRKDITLASTRPKPVLTSKIELPQTSSFMAALTPTSYSVSALSDTAAFSRPVSRTSVVHRSQVRTTTARRPYTSSYNGLMLTTCADMPCFSGVQCEPTQDGEFKCGRCPFGYTGDGIQCKGKLCTCCCL